VRKRRSRCAGAVTVPCPAEQASATEQIVKSSDAIVRTVSTVNRSISEQATATGQITRASASMRQQADQAAKALKEQSRAMRDMSAAVTNTAKQIKLITHANREHSQVSGTLLTGLADVRKVTDRNARGVQQTRQNTADLLRHAEALNEIVDPRSARPHGANGRGTGTNGH
jgi:methyl-accepting chemotaxis protein